MRLSTTALTMTLLAGATQHAYAGDAKSYPATLCQGQVFEIQTTEVQIGLQRYPVSSLLSRPAAHVVTGAAYNDSTQAEMMMACPIVRDVVRADNLGWSTLAINVLNLSTTRALSCTAETFFKDDYSFGSMSSASLPANRNWTDLWLSTLVVPLDGNTIVRCNLPRRDPNGYPSGIASYRIDE